MVFGALLDVVALKGGTATARVLSTSSMATRGTTLLTTAAESPSVLPLADGVWGSIESWRSANSSIFQSFRKLAEDWFVYQVDADASLPSKDLTSALTELIRQMTANSTSVLAATVSAGAQTAVGTPTGDPVIVVSVKNNKGQTQQTPFAETLRFEVMTESQSGATARNESIRCQGKAAVSDVFSHLWPGGSACNVNLNIADSVGNNSLGNVLCNSDWRTFTTTNYPDDWAIATGTVTTNVLAAGAGFLGDNAIKFLGDVGGTLTGIWQKFNTARSTSAGAGGTPATLLPNTQFSCCLWTKVSAVPSAGVLQVALVDGSGTVLVDAAGNNCSFTISLPGETTSYASHTGSFCTPPVMPTSAYLRLKLTTAIDSAKSVFIDSLAMTPTTELYAGGPSVAVFAGDVAVVKGDKWTSAISATHSVFAQWMERVFQLNAKRLVLPYHASPTIADSVVA